MENPGSDSLSPELESGAPADSLLSRLGARVRELRKQKKLSRAELARGSGISVRFLAQLEAGEANISLMRLHEVAAALETGVVDLLAADGAPLVSAAAARARIERLLSGCTTEELDEVAAILGARFAPTGGPLVALLGLRGAGKSTVGAELAAQLGVGFYELDTLIERDAGLSLEQIFELQGPRAYRQLENQVLSRFLSNSTAGVLATGGGIVSEPDTFALLQQRCTTVWLRATPEEHWQRVVEQGDRRPMAGNPSAMEELRGLLARREPLYAQAHLAVDTSGRTVDVVARDLSAAIRRRPTRVGRRA